tara:strand:- start:10977 stop:12374 length:1398 start_codon:yes stop_codon:yes gene_type:complete
MTLFFLVYNLEIISQGNNTITVDAFEVFPGILLSFRIESLGLLFALLASFLWIINSIYSIGYMRANTETNQTRFYIFFCLSIFAVMGLAFSANLVTFFLFYEALTLFTYPLVTHNGSSAAVRGGRVYLGALLGTSICFLLLAIILTYNLAGSTEFSHGGILPTSLSKIELAILLVLFCFGIGKAALVPFHFWLPAAMVAPTPVSALLHAVAVVKAGVFGILKIFVFIFGFDILAEANISLVISLVAATTIIFASIKAIRANNLKERLAFSTVSQLSYIIFAVSLLSPLAFIAAVYHLVAHAFGKITLFFAAGAIYTSLHKVEISELRGVGFQMPVTMICFSIAAVSMIGLPPTAGFITKWFIFSGATDWKFLLAVGVMTLSTLLNIGYFFPIIFNAFFRKPLEIDSSVDGLDKKKEYGHYSFYGNFEAPLPILIAISLTAVCVILLFVFPSYPLAIAENILWSGP